MNTGDENSGQATTQPGESGGDAGAGAGGQNTVLTTGDGTASKTAEGAEGSGTGAEAGDGKADAGNDGDNGKAGDGKTEEKSDADKGKADGPPEKYEFTMPDGVTLDEALVEKASPVLRELGLSNEQANKLATLIAEQRVSEAQAQSDAYAQQVEDWGKSAQTDKEYGGAAFEENVKLAQKAIGKFGTPELKTLLSDGLGNHPEIIRLCVRVGQAMREDGGVEGRSASTPKSAAQVLFDHPTSQPKR